MIIFLSLMFYCLFLYGIINGILKTLPLEIVGGLEWYEYVCNGGGLVACVRVDTVGEGGHFLSCWCVRTN